MHFLFILNPLKQLSYIRGKNHTKFGTHRTNPFIIKIFESENEERGKLLEKEFIHTLIIYINCSSSNHMISSFLLNSRYLSSSSSFSGAGILRSKGNPSLLASCSSGSFRSISKPLPDGREIPAAPSTLPPTSIRLLPSS